MPYLSRYFKTPTKIQIPNSFPHFLSNQTQAQVKEEINKKKKQKFHRNSETQTKSPKTHTTKKKKKKKRRSWRTKSKQSEILVIVGIVLWNQRGRVVVVLHQQRSGSRLDRAWGPELNPDRWRAVTVVDLWTSSPPSHERRGPLDVVGDDPRLDSVWFLLLFQVIAVRFWKKNLALISVWVLWKWRKRERNWNLSMVYFVY